VLYKFSDFKQAIEEVNKSRFGLQAGASPVWPFDIDIWYQRY
jgi:hypothetical protein